MKNKKLKILKECKDCVHYWERKGKKSICTHEFSPYKIGEKLEFACIHFEK